MTTATPNYKVTKFPQGTFSWADCITTDAATAKQFYMDLLGWEANDVPMGGGAMYTMYEQDGVIVAGLGPMQQALQASGVPSHWANYISVDDVDALAEKVTELGGTVVAPPFDIFENGRMMTIQDPTGATVSFWQAKSHIGAYMVNCPGAMMWNELSTRQVEAAQDFYGKLLGWTFETDETGYTMIRNNGRPNGGLVRMDESYGDMPSAWTAYFHVADIEAAVKKVPELGGVVLNDGAIMDAGAAGRFAMINDPSGAHVHIMQSPRVDEWPTDL